MRLTVDLAKINPLHDVRDKSKLAAITKDMIDNGWVGAPDAPPEQALYRIQQTYPDGSGSRLNVDWEGLLRLHDLIHDRIALEGRVCETCDTKGCHRPATWYPHHTTPHHTSFKGNTRLKPIPCSFYLLPPGEG